MSNNNMLLRQVDGTQIAIQRAAAGMMKLYDSGSVVAVTEWRNVLQTARDDQILPLLYVCNEVLQTSKRNRGNKFLEAYSPVLSQSLQHMAHKLRNADMTEKIRRVVKIWGDRQVFSIRFINELLTGLEPYRKGGKLLLSGRPQFDEDVGEAEFSPGPSEPKQAPPSTAKTDRRKETSNDQRGNDDDNSDDDDIMDIIDNRNRRKDDSSDDERRTKERMNDDDDDDDDIFGDQSQNSEQLKIEINVDDVAAAAAAGAISKRRRGSLESYASSTSNNNNATKKRKKSLPKKSMSQFLDIWNRLIQLQKNFDLAQLTLQRISNNIAAQDNSSLENLVGDELLEAKKQNDADILLVTEQRVILHQTAAEQYALEQQIKEQYVPWFEAALQQDKSDVAFCDKLEQTLIQYQPIHKQIVAARNQMRAEQDLQKRQQEEVERKRREAEEAERFRRAALAKETEAKPGMVWNPSTREYQALNTDESWRD